MSIELNSAYMSEETFRINQVPYISNQETRKQEEDFRRYCEELLTKIKRHSPSWHIF